MRDLLTEDPGFTTPSTPVIVTHYIPLLFYNGQIVSEDNCTRVYPSHVNATYSFGFPRSRNISDLPADFWDTNFRKTIREKTGARKVASIEENGELRMAAYGVRKLEGYMELTDRVKMGLHSAHLLYQQFNPHECIDIFLRGRNRGVYYKSNGGFGPDSDAVTRVSRMFGDNTLWRPPRGFDNRLQKVFGRKPI